MEYRLIYEGQTFEAVRTNKDQPMPGHFDAAIKSLRDRQRLPEKPCCQQMVAVGSYRSLGEVTGMEEEIRECPTCGRVSFEIMWIR